jgi:two-component system, NtrC family, sensor kinase
MIGRAVRRALGPDCEVELVTSGADALARIDSAYPGFDVILCDLLMHGINGMDVHDELLRRRSLAATRMVFLTRGPLNPESQAFLDSLPNPRIDRAFDAAGLRDLIRTVGGS